VIVLDTNVVSELMKATPAECVISWVGSQPTSPSGYQGQLNVDLPESRVRRIRVKPMERLAHLCLYRWFRHPMSRLETSMKAKGWRRVWEQRAWLTMARSSEPAFAPARRVDETGQEDFEVSSYKVVRSGADSPINGAPPMFAGGAGPIHVGRPKNIGNHKTLS